VRPLQTPSLEEGPRTESESWEKESQKGTRESRETSGTASRNRLFRRSRQEKMIQKRGLTTIELEKRGPLIGVSTKLERRERSHLPGKIFVLSGRNQRYVVVKTLLYGKTGTKGGDPSKRRGRKNRVN